MLCSLRILPWVLFAAFPTLAAESPLALPADPQQALERTCFQTSQPWSGRANLRSDVAIAYGIGPKLPDRINSWRDHGYRVHVMTGVAWGQYQDYLYGRFDGVNHEDEIQTERNGNPHRHGESSDVFYMCPGTNYGKFLCVGIQQALEAGAEAVHLEEPEFWVQDGYEAAFKREWRNYYGSEWQPPHSSVDAQWRASKLKYFLYRRALQQVFDYVQDFNRRTGRHVRCYVPTHSLINYAQWHIVSPESSLARLEGCDGYIAQVWTGTARTPNLYRGQLRERTFETAFLEYGAMQNLVRSTGRQVWYLNDPIEDNPNHDWADYRRNWESTLVASLLQPEVWRYEVAPWPERIFRGRYPRRAEPGARQSIPPAYATELQTVMNALNDMNQPRVQWDCGTSGLGVLVSDSLMFERGEPASSDLHLSHIYGLALPLLKRGMPVTPVQLENLTVPRYLEPFHLLLLTYQGMKPLSAEVHAPLADWVKRGGALVVVDDDSDACNRVQEWWNSGGHHYATPREHLFEQLGLNEKSFAADGKPMKVGKGFVVWLRENPARLATSPEGDLRLLGTAKEAAVATHLNWRETNYLLLRRGPYLLAAGLEESVPGAAKVLQGNFVNLFDADLQVRTNVTLMPGTRCFLLDLEQARDTRPRVLVSACKALPLKSESQALSMMVEGVADTPAVVLIRATRVPRSVTLAGRPLDNPDYSAADHLLLLRFANEASPRELRVSF
jgi:hypothetical protein